LHGNDRPIVVIYYRGAREHFSNGVKVKNQVLLCTGWPQKSKPLPNDQKIILNHIKACQWDQNYSSN